jgi:hypothetical protein
MALYALAHVMSGCVSTTNGSAEDAGASGAHHGTVVAETIAPPSDTSLADAGSPADVLAADTLAADVEATDAEAAEIEADLAGPEVSKPTDCLKSPIECEDGDVPPGVNPPVEAAGDAGCPPGMVGVTGEFCVDRVEAALVWSKPNGPDVMWSPYLNPGEEPVTAISVPGILPQGYITQVQAKAACEAASKRLCSDVEWLRACQGPGGGTYPYGDSYVPGGCNDTRECHPIVQLFETTADWIWSELGNSCVNQLPDGLVPTGSYPVCESAEGAFDLSGSLHEWTSDPSGTFRGGFYVDATTNGLGCLYKTTAHNVAHWDYSTGFRCCADRGPGF